MRSGAELRNSPRYGAPLRNASSEAPLRVPGLTGDEIRKQKGLYRLDCRLSLRECSTDAEALQTTLAKIAKPPAPIANPATKGFASRGTHQNSPIEHPRQIQAAIDHHRISRVSAKRKYPPTSRGSNSSMRTAKKTSIMRVLTHPTTLDLKRTRRPRQDIRAPQVPAALMPRRFHT